MLDLQKDATRVCAEVHELGANDVRTILFDPSTSNQGSLFTGQHDTADRATIHSSGILSSHARLCREKVGSAHAGQVHIQVRAAQWVGIFAVLPGRQHSDPSRTCPVRHEAV